MKKGGYQVARVIHSDLKPKKKKQSVLPKRPFLYKVGKRARVWFDQRIADGSLIPTDPLLDAGVFEWSGPLREQWEAIRAEAQGLLPNLSNVPPLREVSPDHRRIMREDSWRSLFLWGYGYKVEENCRRCPRTAALVETIPGLNSAFFSILMPGSHIRSHRGPTKALVTCHLGLMVPPDEGCRMNVAGNDVLWTEGDWLVFDDTYRHEVWNDTSEPRVILLVQVKQPVRGPGRLVADLFLGAIRYTPFVQEGRRNIAAWRERGDVRNSAG